MSQFSFTNEKVDTGNSLIPAGTLTWAVVNVRAIKNSQATGAEFADLELTCLGGAYENRKLFTNVMSPQDERHSEAGRQMGFGAILHMVESAGLVDPGNIESYQWLNAVSFTDIMAHLDGKAVAIKTKHEKDKTGAYPDRDGVGEWLSPNPVRTGTAFKGYQALAEGRQTLKPAIPAVPTVAQQGPLPFGARPAQAPAQVASAFGKPAGAPAAAPAAPGPMAQPGGAVQFGAPRPPLPGAVAAPAAGAPAVGPAAAGPSWLGAGPGGAVQTQPGTPVAVAADGMPA